jgi:phage shock protein A
MELGRFLREFMAPAPDPRRTSRSGQSVGPSALDGVRAALEAIAEARSQLAARTVQIRERLPHLEDEAREALAAGRDDLARYALERRQVAAGELELLERQLAAADLEAERLEVTEQQLAARIDALVARERILEARRNAAEIRVQVSEALAGISDDVGRVVPDLFRAEQHAEDLEARAAAIDCLLKAEPVGQLEVELKLVELERELGRER